MPDKKDDGTGSLNKREFIKALGAGAALTGAAIAGGAAAPAFAQEAGDIEWDHDVDVVVAGGGNGGISAALAAADGGANTLLLEISTQIGGNSLMSGGTMHTAAQHTWEDYNRYTFGEHDQVLGKVYVETYWNEYVPFLQSHNAYMSRPTPDAEGLASEWSLGHGEPGQLRHKLYFDSLVEAYEGLGGVIARQTRVTKLLTDENGYAIGVQARVWQNSPREPLETQRVLNVRARKIILATGGFIMDGEKRQLYFGQDGHVTTNQCGPFSSGEGLRMAQAVGAALSHSGWPTFSGTPYALTAASQFNSDPDRMIRLWAEVPPEDWNQYYSLGKLSPPSWIAPTVFPWGGTCRGILVNKLGVRFTDESSTVHARYPRLPQAIGRQPGGYAWLIGDQEIHDATPGSAAAIQRIIDEGGVMGNHGNVIIADTIEEFANLLSASGVYKGAFLRTIEEYNAAVDAGTQEDLPVPHSTEHGSGGFAIRSPRFYAIPVSVQIYMTFGGLRINEDAQVLDPQGVAIPNLYAVPPLAGGIQNGVYTGAIACAGTFGFRAARHATAALDGSA